MAKPTYAAIASLDGYVADRDGNVDECHVLLVPVVVGGGTRFLPDDVRFRLDLRDHRGFGNGTVHLHYGIVDRAALR